MQTLFCQLTSWWLSNVECEYHSHAKYLLARIVCCLRVFCAIVHCFSLKLLAVAVWVQHLHFVELGVHCRVGKCDRLSLSSSPLHSFFQSFIQYLCASKSHLHRLLLFGKLSRNGGVVCVYVRMYMMVTCPLQIFETNEQMNTKVECLIWSCTSYFHPLQVEWRSPTPCHGSHFSLRIYANCSIILVST